MRFLHKNKLASCWFCNNADGQTESSCCGRPGRPWTEPSYAVPRPLSCLSGSLPSLHPHMRTYARTRILIDVFCFCSLQAGLEVDVIAYSGISLFSTNACACAHTHTKFTGFDSCMVNIQTLEAIIPNLRIMTTCYLARYAVPPCEKQRDRNTRQCV